MMMKKLDKKATEYTIDMTAIKEDGSFDCPKCGKSISPEEPESDDTYQIIDTKVVGDLAVLVFSCAKCKSTLKLPGIPTDIEV